MRLFAHSRHVYEDRGARVFIEIASGQWREVSDAVGGFLLTAHSQKLCDVTAEANPDKHKCKKAALYVTSQLQPERTTVLVPQGRSSHQRLQTRRNALRRSRVARMNPAARG